jgi:peptidoglycan hydrolase-like protein with peptidoglycan-binding domain
MAEPVLRKGSTDPAVRDLQEALKALGHDPGPVDGVFGATMEAAVKAFQQAKGIAVNGVVGRVTWINIDEADQSEPVLKIGSTGLPVRRAQKRHQRGWGRWSPDLVSHRRAGERRPRKLNLKLSSGV